MPGAESRRSPSAISAVGPDNRNPYWAFVGKDPTWVEETCASGFERVHAVDRELDIWAQNFGLDTDHQADLPDVYRIIGAARPDAIWSFWWWRACDDPATVMRLISEYQSYFGPPIDTVTRTVFSQELDKRIEEAGQALATAAIYGGFLWLRYGAGQRGRRTVYVSLYGFASILVTFFGAELLSGRHSYMGGAR